MGVENLGNTILELRHKKGVTQEVLADFVGVTKASVSKWETGTTMPDIQVLPLLAAYFEVSVDELIGYVPMLSREQIRFHYRRLAENFSSSSFGEVFGECREMVKKYYACYPFLHQMTVLLLNHVDKAAQGAERELVFKVAFGLCDHILTGCKDVEICENTIAVRCCLYLMEGRADLVLEELGEEPLRPDHIEDRGGLVTVAYLMTGECEQAARAAQVGMYKSLKNLFGYCTWLLQARGGERTYGDLILQRMDELIETFSMVHLDPNSVAVYQYQAALYLLGQVQRETCGMVREDSGPDGTGQDSSPENLGGDFQKHGNGELEERIFSRLERYVAACRQLLADDLKLHGDPFFDRLDSWLEELELGTAGVRSRRSVRENVLEILRSPAFAGLKDQKRLRRLEQELAGNQEEDSRGGE